MCVTCLREMEVERNAAYWAKVFHDKSVGMGYANRKTADRVREVDRERKAGVQKTPRHIRTSGKASKIARQKLLAEFPKGSYAGEYKIVGKCVVEVGGSTCIRAKWKKRPSKWVSVLTLRKHKNGS